MNSILKIYKTVLTPARNAYVENIEYYLTNEAELYYEEETFQYQRFNLDLSITVNIPQEALSQQDVGNYVSITQDGKTWYYFVVSYEWKSPNALMLKLSIDSVNTFQNEFVFSDKTTIDRQHAIRWQKEPATADRYIKLIDEQAEEVEVIRYKDSDEIIQQTKDELDWFLIYKTREELNPENPNNPISCYCCADKPIIVSRSGGEASMVITPSTLQEGQYNYVLGKDNSLGSFTFRTRTGADFSGVLQYGNRTITIDENYMVVVPIYAGEYGNTGVPIPNGHKRFVYKCRDLKFVNLNGTISLWVYGSYVSTLSSQGSIGNPFWSDDGYLAVNEDGIATLADNEFTINTLNFARVSNDGDIPIAYADELINQRQYYNIGENVVRTVSTFSSIDKTDSKIVKLIRLPYAPCEITYNSENDVYEFPNIWVYENGLMKLNDASLSSPLESAVTTVQLDAHLLKYLPAEERLNNVAKDKQYESKLSNSQFTEMKFAYDSFSAPCRLEAFNIKPRPIFSVSVGLPLKFKQTNTINSKFLFDLGYPQRKGLIIPTVEYKYNQDYENILAITRNNEETIFSNDYLNYIRSGYNYDKKLKQQEATISGVMTGLQLVGAVASFASSAVTGGIGIAAGITLATSATTSLINTANQATRGQNELKQKLYELSLQSSSVAGTDDVDLMKYYSDNKLHQVIYKPYGFQENAIAQLFFYCGYKHKALELPKVNTRYWFNYIQCNPVFLEEENTPYNRFLDDIKARYAAGLTVYHWHPRCNGGKTSYDWNQEYENWETNLVVEKLYPEMVAIREVDQWEYEITNLGPKINNTTIYIEFDTGDNTTNLQPISFGGSKRIQLNATATNYRIVNIQNSAATSEWKEIPMEV